MAQMFQTLARTMNAKDSVTARCEACGHQARWTQAQAFAAFGPDASPYAVRRRLRCSRCGGGAIQAWI